MLGRDQAVIRGSLTTVNRESQSERPYSGINGLAKQIKDWVVRAGAAFIKFQYRKGSNFEFRWNKLARIESLKGNEQSFRRT